MFNKFSKALEGEETDPRHQCSEPQLIDEVQ